MHRNSQGQMELMGLAVIIVLVALGMLFALYFVLSAPANANSHVRETMMAANFLNTLSRTTTDCFGRDVTWLLQDCAKGGSVDCPAGDTRAAEGSCERASALVQKTLLGIFGYVHRTVHFEGKGAAGIEDLKFTVVCPSQDCSLAKGKDAFACPGEKVSKTDPIPVGGFEIALTLDICIP